MTEQKNNYSGLQPPKKQFWIMLSPCEKGFRSGSAIRETERPFMTPSRINLTVVAQFMCLFQVWIYQEIHAFSTFGFLVVLPCLYVCCISCFTRADRIKFMQADRLKCRILCFNCVFSKCTLLLFKVHLTSRNLFLGT